MQLEEIKKIYIYLEHSPIQGCIGIYKGEEIYLDAH